MPQNRFYSFDVIHAPSGKSIVYALVRLNGILRSIDKAKETIIKILPDVYPRDVVIIINKRRIAETQYHAWRNRAIEQGMALENRYVKQVGAFFIFKTGETPLHNELPVEVEELTGGPGKELLRLEAPDFNSEDNVPGGEAFPFAPNVPKLYADSNSAASLDVIQLSRSQP